MDNDTDLLFTVIVPEGSSYTSCHGRYRIDAELGYVGRLFLYGYEPTGGSHNLFDLPEFLTGEILSLITEKGRFATLCFPRFSKQTWSNFSSLSVELSFRLLVDNLHINSEEQAVSSLTITSTTLATLVGVRPVAQSFALPFTEASAVFALSRPYEWSTDEYNIRIGDTKQIGATPDNQEGLFSV